MSRSEYVWLASALLLLGALFAYRTAPPAPPAAGIAEFGGVSLNLDYATSTADRERGLGGRTSVPDGYGMLFVFSQDDRYGFWMKDMLVPLDMFWLDSKGHVVSIQENVATSSYPYVFYPTADARYVLETAAGFAHAHNITEGMPLLLKNFPIVSE